MVHMSIISLLATVCAIRTARTKIPCSRLELRFWKVAVGSSGAPLTRSIGAVNALNAEISLGCARDNRKLDGLSTYAISANLRLIYLLPGIFVYALRNLT